MYLRTAFSSWTKSVYDLELTKMAVKVNDTDGAVDFSHTTQQG